MDKYSIMSTILKYTRAFISHVITTVIVVAVLGMSSTAIAQNDCKCSILNTASSIDTAALAQHQEPACRAKAFELQADRLLQLKKFDSALSLLDKAQAIYQQQQCAASSFLSLWKLYAGLYENQAAYSQSLSYYLKVLDVAEQLRDKQEQAETLLNIAQIFNRLKQPEKGIAYTRQAVPLVQQLELSHLQATLLNKVAARYFFHAQDLKEMRYADTAELFVNNALSVAKQLNNVKEQIIAYTRLSAICERRKQYPMAIGYIQSALQMCQPGINNRQYTTLYGDLGNILMKLGRYAEARRYADSCLLYCQLEKYPPLIMNAYALIYTIEEKAGHYKEAIAALKVAQAISDSLTSADRIRVVNELENKYDQAKNEKTILELSQQKKISLLMAGMAILVAISIAFFLRQQTLKHRQKVLETEQRLNRARMNPHFFFNALASLQTMAVKNEDGKALAMNLSKFSHIMRETLESTYKEYVTIEQEIDFLNEYLTLQKIRFPEKFEFQISCASNLEPDAYMIPSMIIQPFAENAVEHGFQGMQSVGKLNITFSIDGHSLKVTITDNGKGLADAKHIQKEHISRASQIIKDRIYLLNLKLKTKASFSIDNRKDNDGVEVIIYLPIIESNDITDY